PSPPTQLIMTQRRVVSLLPSATEIVCCVGAVDQLVGVSHECDHPPGVAGRPILTQARMHAASGSLAIHRSVQDALQDALAIYTVDREKLAELAPDVIVTQDLCDVCAVSFAEVCAAIETWLDHKATVVSLQPQRLGDIWEDIRRTGAALNREAEAKQAVDALLARVEAVREVAAHQGTRPKVVTLEWIEPPMLGGLWMAELIALAGGSPLGHGPGEKSRVSTQAELEALDPDVVVIKPCGFTLEQTRPELARVQEAIPTWTQWTAVREDRVFVADGNAYFNRPGPRIVDSLEILAASLHPEAFGHLRDRYPNAVQRWRPDGTLEPW
ncbi:MAG: cobalamin-binding protein, partial [Myxococcota bacterium]